ncbi:protein phosphatase 2C domain-containing protein [Paenibacillus vini]|uniref:Protein phosphatase n=1 Tax=Paenibacillus vini TaxID=1476024 RepID=A0ABQ4MCB4_9BACL|nr:protein phosphatase 2C domain-containing protein [Paenibacillus vini]GIP53621.1 protein phosphatase [Paenibacillus vini]
MQYEWLGSHQPYLDEANIETIGNIHIGAFGGSTSSGANNNEDALFVLQDEGESWTFSALLDAHNSSQSAELIIELLKTNKNDLINVCSSDSAFLELEPFFLKLFTDSDFKKKCKNVTGETSCLFCFQRGEFLWWFSIGDCMAFLFHPDLVKFKQYGLNQRQFFEWIGQVNTFDLSVPCYTVGRRQLRKGTNYILLLTDGVMDTTDELFTDPHNLYDTIVQADHLQKGLRTILDQLKNQGARDSATIVCWEFFNDKQGQQPSD